MRGAFYGDGIVSIRNIIEIALEAIDGIRISSHQVIADISPGGIGQSETN